MQGMPSLIFWDADTQHDFVSPRGKLYLPEAEIREWASRGVPLITTAQVLSGPALESWL